MQSLFWLILYSLNLLSILCHVETKLISKDHNSMNSSTSKLPIVFVYTVVPGMCKRGLPSYLKISLEQALLTQPDCHVVMASNYGDCPNLVKLVESIPDAILIDTTKLMTNRTREFNILALDVFQTDSRGELWITSALRFLIMEEIMISMNYTEMLHVEADNMLYGRMSSILSIFRNNYTGIAATPLFANKVFITASVFWIHNLQAIQKFNHFLFSIASRNKVYSNYLKWIRKYACCKQGGVDPDENGNGVKPFAINEMSMLGYYHVLYPDEFKLLPVVPNQLYYLNRHVCNMTEFSPGGVEVGHKTGEGIWDPNSWGQYVGGTSTRVRRSYTDSSHVIGQAIKTTGCNISMECSRQTNSDFTYSNGNAPYYVTNKWVYKCLTAPYVRCTGGDLTRLWNMHVHSKITGDYSSQACDCHNSI